MTIDSSKLVSVRNIASYFGMTLTEFHNMTRNAQAELIAQYYRDWITMSN